MSGFLHGINIVQLKTKGSAISFPASSIICLVGVSAYGAVNQLIQCLNTTDAAQFGANVPGNTIANALDSIYASGDCPVFVVNVFNSGSHLHAVTSEVVAVANNKFKLANSPAPAPALVLKDSTNTTTYVLGTDYTIDAFGNGTVISNAIATGNIHATYSYLDDTQVVQNDIIGTDTGGNNKTGLQLFKLLTNTFGVKPKIVIAPGFSQIPAVSAAMASIATFGRGIYPIDSPAGTSVSNAISGRGIGGTFGWNIADRRAMLMFNRFAKANPDPAAANGSIIYDWYSAWMAGIIANMDNTIGYYNSPSNKPLPPEALSPEIPITCSLTDNSYDNQQLNAAGIVAYNIMYGSGINTFGNYSSYYPANTDPTGFTMVQRITDVLDDMTEKAMIPLLDSPITQAFIDYLVELNNTIIRTLTGIGALVPGSTVVANPSDNTPTTLAAGQIVLSRNYASAVPMNNLTIKSTFDVTLLANLVPQS